MPAKGDGISKRKDGRYMARYTVQTPDVPKRKTIYGSKYKDVEKKLRACTNRRATLRTWLLSGRSSRCYIAY